MPESKYKDTPTARALLERFNAQEHRLEINDCELVYNGRPFFLGMTVEEISNVLGSPPDYTEGYATDWTHLNFRMGRNKETNLIQTINFPLSRPRDEDFIPTIDVILLNGAPLDKDMLFGEFLQHSHYEFEDFSILYHNFELLPTCPGLQKHVIEIGSRPAYDSRGYGHFTFRGDFDPTTTEPVRTIIVYYPSK